MTFRYLFTLAMVIALAGCGSKPSRAHPKTLRFAYVVNSELVEEELKNTEPLRKYLSSQMGMPVEIQRVISYAPTIEALCAAKSDIANAGPFAYILASQKGCVEALAVRGTADGRPSGYRSVIATHKDSGVHSIGEMKAQSHRLTLTFNDPASTSGHLVPRAALVSMGLDPERDFKTVMFAPSHLASAMTLKAEKVDVACMMEAILPRLYDAGKMSRTDVKILWTSDSIPASPIEVRKDLAPELKNRLLEAFLHMHEKNPDLFRVLGLASRTTGTQYVAAKDSMYDGLRETARNVPTAKLLDK